MQEEERFLRDPGQAFGAAHFETLRTIRDRIGLDYFGIDCGLDRDNHLVVFEVNASMLLHDLNPDFPYKDRYIRGIKIAFDAMLECVARGIHAAVRQALQARARPGFMSCRPARRSP
jgi:hypothetical protein